MKTNDFNKTEEVKAQGPLKETLAAMDEWDINKLKDPVAYGQKDMKGGRK